MVTARGEGDERRLVGYVVPAGGAQLAPSAAQLRGRLKADLPEYMVPAVFVTLDVLPLSPNGKVDRAALPEPDERADREGAAFVAPRDDVERVLAALWAELLDVDQVGAEDDFFALGGHSLLATRLASAPWRPSASNCLCATCSRRPPSPSRRDASRHEARRRAPMSPRWPRSPPDCWR